MNNWVRRNQSAISLGLGAVFLIAWLATRDDVMIPGAVLMFVVALVGDRLKKAPGGFEFFRGRFNEQVRAEVPPPVTGTAASLFGWESHATGTVYERTAEDTPSTAEDVAAVVAGAQPAIGTGEVFRPTVVASSAQALLAASNALDTAATPEELAERVVDYVSLRTVPGLRALSADRIRREQALFGAILELQTLRSWGIQIRDPGRLADAISEIEEFWSHPERLSDGEVENVTSRVIALIGVFRVENKYAGASAPGRSDSAGR